MKTKEKVGIPTLVKKKQKLDRLARIAKAQEVTTELGKQISIETRNENRKYKAEKIQSTKREQRERLALAYAQAPRRRSERLAAYHED